MTLMTLEGGISLRTLEGRVTKPKEVRLGAETPRSQSLPLFWALSVVRSPGCVLSLYIYSQSCLLPGAGVDNNNNNCFGVVPSRPARRCVSRSPEVVFW